MAMAKNHKKNRKRKRPSSKDDGGDDAAAKGMATLDEGGERGSEELGSSSSTNAKESDNHLVDSSSALSSLVREQSAVDATLNRKRKRKKKSKTNKPTGEKQDNPITNAADAAASCPSQQQSNGTSFACLCDKKLQARMYRSRFGLLIFIPRFVLVKYHARWIIHKPCVMSLWLFL